MLCKDSRTAYLARRRGVELIQFSPIEARVGQVQFAIPFLGIGWAFERLLAPQFLYQGITVTSFCFCGQCHRDRRRDAADLVV